MKRTEAIRVDTIIRMAMESTGTMDTYHRQQVCFAWPEIVGPAINRCTTRRWIDRDVMHVCITSASLKNELGYISDQLIKRLNNAVGADVIRKIVFH